MNSSPTLRPVSPARRRRSGGNSMVEAVFTLLPTLALIFGVFDFGLMTFRWTTLQMAVREGCRYGITFQLKSGMNQDASIKSVVQTYAMGLVTTSDSPVHIFVNYYAPTNLNAAIATPNGNIPGNIVEVSVQNVSYSWLAPLSGSYGAGLSFFRSSTPLTLAIYSSDVLGGYPVGVNSVAR